MLGQMMKMPLTLSSLLEFAARYHAGTEIVSRTVEGPIHRQTYAEAARRTRKLANALTGKLGVKPGDIVGTLAWNGYRHFEIYYAAPGIGAVCHTVNPRLFVEQIVYIVNHAEDRYLFLDLSFVPLVEGLAGRLTGVKGYVIMTDRAHMPETSLPNVHCYEELIADQPDSYDWPALDENQASGLCYTSGTTGNPRGVLYSHRSTLLHAFATNFADVFGLAARDVVMPVVPMFHANGWGMIQSAPMTGAKLVLPGPQLDGSSLTSLIAEEGVTITAGVPTVWLGLLAQFDKDGRKPATLERVVIGGSTCPPAMMEAFERYGVRTIHAWGMTEISPLGCANAPTTQSESLPAERQAAIALKQGRAIFGAEMKIVDVNDQELPWDGIAFGSLKVRGHWICEGYFRLDDSGAHDAQGWFETGDVATIDAMGFMQIVDRTKDVIKSGGEWISSIDLENVAMNHPGVFEAAAIGRPDQKWGERPIVIVVPKPGMAVTPEEIRELYRGKVGKWCEPDEVLVADSLPHTATGKILKTELRKIYAIPAA